MVMQKSLSTAMNAKIFGSGKETIILAHGYGGDHSVWDKVVSSLAQVYQVVVFDWCFSGAVKDRDLFDAVKYSSYDPFADDLIDLMEEMNLKSSVFVGHSMSGIVGCIASVKRPDLFNRLVLVSSTPRLINSEDYEGSFEISHVEQIFASIETNYDQWATTFASIVVDNRDPPSAEKFAGSLKRMGSQIALPLAKTVFLSDYRNILEKVTIPCTIIRTTNDPVVPNSVPIYMQNKIKGKSTVEIIHTEGHFPQLTAHVEFLDVLYKVLITP
ncbi:hypothetical protein ACH5RR_005943 [Cinchona calisaya]|uniref:AB hydrolase-1 domain-containing protein n=1 Tax=Cinchona calisaya TaxID=153742 RepID=A0ABD3AMR6_9GENT